MKISRILCASTALLLSLGAAPAAHAYVKATWFNASNAGHKVVTGQPTVFKAACDNPAATTIEVTLAGAPVASGAGTNSYALETDPVVLTAGGSYTITVKDAGGAQIGSTDTYVVTLVSGTVTDLKEIAIEKGLWYLHKTMTRYATIPNSAPGGFLDYNGDPINYPNANPGTVMAGQAFVDAGHTLAINADDPYVEDVQRIINWTTEHLGIVGLGSTEGRTSTTYAAKDSRGAFLMVHDGSTEVEYGFGPALKFLATCGYARTSTATPQAWNDALNCGTGASIRTYSFPRIMQEMVDFIAWAQLNTVGNDYHTSDTFCPNKTTAAVAPGSKGGWPYYNEGWNVDPTDDNNIPMGGNGTYGDVAVAYWTVQGLQAAQTTLNSSNIYPASVKTDLLAFITSHQNLINGEITFGPAHNIHLIERAGQGLVLLQWAGVAATDAKVTNVVNFIKKNWFKHTYHAERGHVEQNFICHDEVGTEKQCYQHFLVDANPVGFWVCDRNANPCTYEIIETLDDINVFAFKTVTEGLAAYPTITNVPAAAPGDYKTFYRGLLIDNQLASGTWDDHGWIQGYQPMGASWAVSTLAKL